MSYGKQSAAELSASIVRQLEGLSKEKDRLHYINSEIAKYDEILRQFEQEFLEKVQAIFTEKSEEYRQLKQEYEKAVTELKKTWETLSERLGSNWQNSMVSTLTTLLTNVRGEINRFRAQFDNVSGIMQSIQAIVTETSEEIVKRDMAKAENERQREKLKQDYNKNKLRNSLKSFISKIESQLSEGSDQSLMWNREEIEKQLASARQLAQSDNSITQETIDQYVQAIDNAIIVSKEKDLHNIKRWKLAELIAETFTQGDFQLDSRLGDPQQIKDGLIEFYNVNNKSDVKVTIQTKIPWDDRLEIVMGSAIGSYDEEFSPNQFCLHNIQDLLLKAEELGVVIQDIIQKDPDGTEQIIYQKESESIRGAGNNENKASTQANRKKQNQRELTH